MPDSDNGRRSSNWRLDPASAVAASHPKRPGEQGRSAYQAHIDGLRAIAVLAVIANHFNKAWLPGGYLGVDIFFVISGFVISASLASRPPLALGPFLLAFYQRRIKRLMPALLMCVVVTATLICLLDPQPRTSLLTGISALFGLSNLYLYQQSMDYFAPAAQSNAFTQTWSLGVEEQFYLVYPALFWIATRGRLGRPERTLPFLIGALSLLSFVAFVMLFPTRPSVAYFLTPARFWELGAGCLVFTWQHSVPAVWLRQRMASLSLLPLLALVACLWAPVERLVPASSAAVLFTCLLLLGPAPGSWCLRALTWAPLRHIGLISYSLYLWHWTVLVLARWSIGIETWHAPWLLTTMLLLAQLSYRWVETPIRHGQVRHPLTRGLGASLVATAALGVLLFQHPRLMLPLDATLREAPAFFPVKGKPFNPLCVVDGEQRRLEASTFDLCTFQPRQPGGQTIWVMGDSHAGHLQGLLYSLRRSTGVGVHLIETPGRPYPYIGKAFEPRERIVEAMYQHAQPGDVLLISRLFLQRGSAGLAEDLSDWEIKVLELARQLQARQMQLVVIGPPPMFDFEHVASCQRQVFGPSACERDREALVHRVEQVHHSLQQRLAGQTNAHVFRSFDTLCPERGTRCSPVFEHTLIYRDRDHLNTAGAALLAEPLLQFMQQRGLWKPAA